MQTVTSLEEILRWCRELIEDSTFAQIRAWKDEHPGRKVAGIFPVYSPAELPYAFGMLPVGLFGGGNRIEIAHADSRFQSFVCSIVKSTLELGLTGRLEPIDILMFSSICDSARNLASVMERNFPNQRIIYLHFPQNPASPGAVTYLYHEYLKVVEILQEVSGRAYSADELARSIELYNEVRAAVAALYRIRRERPHLLSAAESYQLVRVATLMEPRDYVSLVHRILPEIEGRNVKPKDRVRVVLEGAFCEQPPIEFIESLEQAGCYILNDDLLLGWRWFRRPVRVDGDPLRNLAEAYVHNSVFSSVKHDPREPRAKHLLDDIGAHGAQAAVLVSAKFCEPALFDYALYKKALEQHEIPHVFLEFEEKAWVFDKARTEIETFVESMLFD